MRDGLKKLVVKSEKEYRRSVRSALPWWHVRSGSLDIRIQAAGPNQAFVEALRREAPKYLSELGSIRRVSEHGRKRKEFPWLYFLTIPQLKKHGLLLNVELG